MDIEGFLASQSYTPATSIQGHAEERIEAIRQPTETIHDRAEDNENDPLALTAIRELREQITLLARILGLLQPTVVNVALVSSPAWLDLRERITGALTPYPLALQAVLVAIDGSGGHVEAPVANGYREVVDADPSQG